MSDTGYRIADIDPSTPVIDGLRRGGVVEVSYRVQIRSSINKSLADNNYVITNSVTMNGTGVQKDKINQTQIVTNVSDGQLVLMDSAYVAEAASYNAGDGIGVQVTDADQNRNALLAETVQVTVINAVTGEVEALSLVETGADTEIGRAHV